MWGLYWESVCRDSIGGLCVGTLLGPVCRDSTCYWGPVCRDSTGGLCVGTLLGPMSRDSTGACV